MAITLTPQAKIVSVWRIVLLCAALPLAVLCSLVFEPGSLWWIISSLLWALPFLFFYVFYFPLRHRRLSLQIEDNRMVMRTGVFYHIVRSVPFENIQFVGLRASPLHKYWKLATLTVVAPGGRMMMPGLDSAEAERLVGLLLNGQGAQP